MSFVFQFLITLYFITLSKSDGFENGNPQSASKCELAGRTEIPASNLKPLSKCYTHPNSTYLLPVMFTLEDLSKFDYHYDVAQKYICPIWTQNKKCLFDYFKSECDQENYGIIKRTLILNNGEVQFSALFCDGNYREVYRSALRNDLQKCMQSEYSELFKQKNECSRNTPYPGRNESPDYKTYITQYADCLKPSVISCGKGNPLKEKELRVLGNDIEKAYLETHERLWAEYENPTKSSKNTKNEGASLRLMPESAFAKFTIMLMFTASYMTLSI